MQTEVTSRKFRCLPKIHVFNLKLRKFRHLPKLKLAHRNDKNLSLHYDSFEVCVQNFR